MRLFLFLTVCTCGLLSIPFTSDALDLIISYSCCEFFFLDYFPFDHYSMHWCLILSGRGASLKQA